MTATTSELDQASADRRNFGNPALAANAELKVIAEALRELVTELRLLRTELKRPVDAVVVDAAKAIVAPLRALAPTKVGAPSATPARP